MFGKRVAQASRGGAPKTSRSTAENGQAAAPVQLGSALALRLTGTRSEVAPRGHLGATTGSPWSTGAGKDRLRGSAPFFALSLLLASCGGQAKIPSAAAPANARKTVLVDNYPLLYFTQRIAGDAVEAVFPAPRARFRASCAR